MKPPPPKIEGVVFTQDSLGNRGVVGHDVYVNLLAHLAVRNTRQKVDKMALVSDFPRSLLFRMMEVYRIKFEWFDAIVAHGDCDMDPASPERYLKAMEEMGLAEQPFNVVALEANIDGVSTASLAGCYVVGLTYFHTHKELLDAGAADTVPSYFAADQLLDRLKKKKNAAGIMEDRQILPQQLHVEALILDDK